MHEGRPVVDSLLERVDLRRRDGLPVRARTQLSGHAASGDIGNTTYVDDRSIEDLHAELSRVDWTEALVNVLP